MTLRKIAVLGAGSYGTALAISIARKKQDVFLWGRDPVALAAMKEHRENQAYLPGAFFPPSLHIADSLEQCVAQATVILVVVPSYGFSSVLSHIEPLLSEQAGVAWATKGLEPESGRLLSDVAREILGPKRSLAVLSGPTFAKEMAVGMPTAITVAASTPHFLEHLSDTLHNEAFRVYSSDDMIGVQVGGAVKNVIAIGAGLADGIGFGANTRTALITRGLAELTRLGMALGGKAETFTGMAGLGDLILTCTDNQSRNRRLGLAIGQGKSIDEAIAMIGQAVEGYRNTKEVYHLAQRHQVEMPIVEQIYNVLYKNKPAYEAAQSLLGRARKLEGSP